MKSSHDRYNDEDQVDIYLNYESSTPITLKRCKEIGVEFMGLKVEDYEFRMGEMVISDDDMILDDSNFEEPLYEIHFRIYLEEDNRVYYYVPKEKTKEDKVHDINSWYWSYEGDMLKFNTSVKVFNIQQDTYVESDL